jgi:hypothetical protein
MTPRRERSVATGEATTAISAIVEDELPIARMARSSRDNLAAAEGAMISKAQTYATGGGQ